MTHQEMENVLVSQAALTYLNGYKLSAVCGFLSKHLRQTDMDAFEQWDGMLRSAMLGCGMNAQLCDFFEDEPELNARVRERVNELLPDFF